MSAALDAVDLESGALHGPWRLAWQRLAGDRVAVVSLAIVAVFIGMTVASFAGWIAADWSREVGVSHAPPAWFAGDVAKGTAATGMPGASAKGVAPQDDGGIVDPLAGVLAELRAGSAGAGGGAGTAAGEDRKSVV